MMKTTNQQTDIQSLKKENNKLKRDLIEDAYTYIPYFYEEEKTEEGAEEEKEYTKDTITSYLDLACGRGGDIDKIWKANYSRLIGIDINEQALNDEYGYIKRFESRKQYFTTDSTCYQYDVSTILNDHAVPFINILKFDTIGLQYALHYFFKNEESLDNLFLNVKKVLKQHGLFIGIGLDGERMKNLYLRNTEKNIESTLYDIVPTNKNKFINDNTHYGNEYSFNIKGTDESSKTKHYFEEFDKSIEYKTNIPILIQKANYHSLTIERIQHVYNNNDDEQFILNNNKQSYKDIVYLNFIFIFKK